ncbi:hypothetical protein [Campylobacter corcagiensis]|uniref:Excinuclease ABC subunit A n=1 Tax=Campylobacter corcagiensis TaxID=1448857 RepID=A0A7M1LE48_9BACT|nr:hypothetical protein [Campylobacter corcagiensis]QOQ86593.1 hypothetical protein IMC76_05000 [Campylobacter corcagiensis]
MKKILAVILFFVSTINATTLLNYDIIDKGASIELRLSFDSKFNAEILQENSKNGVKFTLKGTHSDDKFTNQIGSPIISDLVIENSKDGAVISVKGSKNLQAAATLIDELTLNISFTDSSITSSLPLEPKNVDKSSNFSIIKTLFWIIAITIILAIVFVIIKIIKKEKNKKEFNMFENFQDENDEQDDKYEAQPIYDEDKIITETSDLKNDSPTSQNNSIDVIYSEKISDDKELILINKDGKVFLNFLSKDNEIPADIYDDMKNDGDKFEEFLKICKNQSRQI